MPATDMKCPEHLLRPVELRRHVQGLRFLCNDPPAARVFVDAFEADRRSSRLSATSRAYYRLRPLIPLRLRQLLQRRRALGVHVADDWYLPHEFMRSLTRALADGSTEIVHPWPDGAPSALVLTHDVETAAGLRGIPKIAAIEERLGLRSSWNLVPYKYRIDLGLVDDLRDRGFEIGIHGYNHDGRLFASPAIFRRRAPAIDEALRKYQAVGFRAPMVHRDLDAIQMLDVDYDASCFDVDPFQAMPGGIGGIWPCLVNDLVELPYTMPQDHTLFVGLGQQTTAAWKHKLAFVRRNTGMALMLTHPDYLDSPSRLQLYADVLAFAKDSGDDWHALPRDVAAWWRRRDALPLDVVKQADERRLSKYGAAVPALIHADVDEVRIQSP